MPEIALVEKFSFSAILHSKMKFNSIGIIGGTNGLGARFASFFKENFPTLKILVSGRSTHITAKDIVEQCDLVIFAVPISQTVAVIQSLVPHSRSDQIWLDFTSVKLQPVQAMLTSKAQVCGMHPVFGPRPEIHSETIIYCPARIEEADLKSLLSLFPHFKLIKQTPQQHDDLMGIVQCVSHFSDMVMAETLKNSGYDFKDITAVSSPPYQLKLEVMGRMFSQNPDLYIDIALQNSSGQIFTQKFVQAAHSLGTKIADRQRDDLIKNFQEAQTYLTPSFCEKSFRHSQYFLASYKPKPKRELPVEKPSEIGIFGEPNSHTDEAAKHCFQSRKKGRYFRHIFRLFEALEDEEILVGIVPYENTYEGAVFEVLDELFDYPNIRITGSVKRPIMQNLIGHCGTPLENIKEVLSHPQALAQSKTFLRKNLPQAEIIQSTSTAVAAQKVCDCAVSDKAAIGSKALAKSLGLAVLAENISLVGNSTRFVVIEKNTAAKPTTTTCFVCWFSHDRAGNLAAVLSYFSESQINLTKLDSRRAERSYGDYLFFIDARLSWDQAPKVVKDLKAFVGGVRILGGY